MYLPVCEHDKEAQQPLLSSSVADYRWPTCCRADQPTSTGLTMRRTARLENVFASPRVLVSA